MAASPQIDSAMASGGAADAVDLKVDLLIAVAGPVEDGRLRDRSTAAMQELRAKPGLGESVRIAIASPAANQTEASRFAPDLDSDIHFLHYPLSPAAQPSLPWLAPPSAYQEIARLAASMSTRGCVVLGQDLAALDAASIEALARPLIEGAALVSVPMYPGGKYEGLLNSGILYPFTRSLYGKHVRHPFAIDFGVAGKMIERLAIDGGRNPVSGIRSPAVEAAAAGVDITQSCVGVRHTPHNDEIDLSTVLSKLCGSLFEDAERNAAAWQRTRGSQVSRILGTPSPSLEDGAGVDVRPLIESFSLGFRNLREVWGLVLPPVSLLELQRLTRMPPEQFRMPDTLWAKIVYDFALAYRLRSINRAHLLGALTPVYLGWVASYTAEVKALDALEAERRIERLAAAYEEAKSYFVSRWRWPDRFNP
jgi:glucosylglycerate synthase